MTMLMTPKFRYAILGLALPPRSPLSHTSVTPIVFLHNSDTLLFVAAVLGYNIQQFRAYPPTADKHAQCSRAPRLRCRV
jgi:hypothetical protein